jgi:predicted nucleic acid-binding protein
VILLDSSILIELFRKKNKQETLFYSLSRSNNDLNISSITYYEIGIGNRRTHFDYWERLSDKLTIIPFDKACSATAIEIYQELLRKNKMIDLADILIGATAVTHKLPLATLNLNHFERIDQLEIINDSRR